MPEQRVGTREEWMAQRRRELPWVPAEKDYRFESAEGSASLADLFTT